MSGPVLAVVFDMDGVLLDSEPLHRDVVNIMLAEYGVTLDEDRYATYIGTTLEYTWADLIRHHNLPHDVAHYRTIYSAAIVESYRLHSVPAPGALELVAGLRERGIPLGLASSSGTPWVAAALEKLGLSSAFTTIVTGDMVANSKPDPEIYLKAAARLGVEPARCLAIEDAPKGAQAAATAGMTVIGVRTEYTANLTLDHAAAVLDDLTHFDYGWLMRPPVRVAAAGDR